MIEWNEYLDKLDKDKRNILLTILKMAKKYSNNAVECMTYGVPGYKLNSKPLIAVAAHKEHYGIYPFSPQVIKASQSLIGDHETSMGTIGLNMELYHRKSL
jgi:uncharacterized protein YdhG (YjbR/CyaY superfamily)